MRLAEGGTHIDRSRPLSFTFDGRAYQGFAGDTLASALLANDVRVVARSFKFHRPRGVFGVGLEEPSALVTIVRGPDREPNLRATEVQLSDGLVACSQNAWPSVRFDLAAINGWLAPLLPAGFYHKTFKWPRWSWYEGAIRRTAGLGRIAGTADATRESKRFHHCDVLVIGAGAAGRAAAEAAAQRGADVTLVDSGRIATLPNVRALPNTTAIGCYEDRLVAAIERIGDRQRLWKIRAAEIVFATGATERPLVFENNDRPGVMLASAVGAYLERYAVVPGRNVAFFTNNDSVYPIAEALRSRDVVVSTIVDTRRDDAVLDSRRVDCDVLAVSGGFNPNLQLFSQAAGKLRYDEKLAAFIPGEAPPGLRCVGAAAGEIDGGVAPRWRSPGNPRKQWVDLQYDVTVADVELAAREGFSSVEHLKRYTSVGMAPDQGKTSDVNALALLGEITGRAIGDVGTTTFRPPYHPVTIAALAGARTGSLAQRYRRLPVAWHEKNGGVMEDHSGWLRAAFYRRDGESEAQAIAREVRAARFGAALFDSSSLGKIEVFGRDAAEFLNRLYVNNVKTLAPGRLRYGMMLGENGVIKDDGVFGCLAPDHYLVCTSSSGARDVAFWMEEWRQCEWRELDVRIVPQTAQWATLTVSGPKSREIVARLGVDIDLSAQAFPHMHVRSGSVALKGDPQVRVRRASYTGEMSFEIDIAAEHADLLWSRLLELGAAENITPLGMEALDVLRVEKGFLEVGVDTDGETTPLDVGWGEAIAKKPEDFLGRRSLSRPAQQRADRLQLVGLQPEDPQLFLPVGVHAVDDAGAPIGHVTSSCVSPTLNRSVAMARIRGGAKRSGEVIAIDIDGTRHRARICDRAFYDPQGARLNG